VSESREQVAEEIVSDADWRLRAEAVVAGGASTGSKRPHTMYGVEHEDAPSHYVDASGCRIRTAGGATLVDCTMALGAVAIGYADPEVTMQAMRRLAAPVAGLTHVVEVEVAERLCLDIPCAERALFFKSGAESVAAAVRLARTYTARDHVVGGGYFGWLDWSSDSAGVPERVRRDFTPVSWGDERALCAAVDAAGPRLAAIVLEPVVEREPPEGYLAAARRLADRSGAVLVFDEIKTGFRMHRGGYQVLCGVTPDLATFGKALANGYPLATVVGRAPIMDAVRRTWISGTLASEAMSLGAAMGVLDRHEREDVCAQVAAAGGRMRRAVSDALSSSGVAGATVQGIDPMWFLRWDDAARESRFLAASRAAGVLFKRGAYNYAAMAHDEQTLIDIEHAASTAFVQLVEETQG
jgi:glutamate-1-semialdehyde 2,1-aminomutase